jgi:hypothetical protein
MARPSHELFKSLINPITNPNPDSMARQCQFPYHSVVAAVVSASFGLSVWYSVGIGSWCYLWTGSSGSAAWNREHCTHTGHNVLCYSLLDHSVSGLAAFRVCHGWDYTGLTALFGGCHSAAVESHDSQRRETVKYSKPRITLLARASSSLPDSCC